MSKFIPPSAVMREAVAHIKRKVSGLKSGHYVKFPDPEKGPHIVLAKKLTEPAYVEAAKIWRENESKRIAAEQAKKDAEASKNLPSVGDASST